MAKCGAKTRNGEPCKNNGMKNGRCRLHGGKSPGAPSEKMQRNKNAVTTGAYETIWLDTLDEEERGWLDKIQTGVLPQIDQEIRLLELRERRMMRRIQSLRDGASMTPTSIEKSSLSNKQVGKSEGQTVHLEPALERIQRIEEALTRVQDRKVKLLDLKHKVTGGEGREKPDISIYIDALSSITKQVWDDEEESE